MSNTDVEKENVKYWKKIETLLKNYRLVNYHRKEWARFNHSQDVTRESLYMTRVVADLIHELEGKHHVS